MIGDDGEEKTSYTAPCSASGAGVDHRDAVADSRTTSISCVITTMVVPEFAVDPAEQPEHLRGGLRVERAGRLVGEQDVRVGRQRAGDADALLLPAGELLAGSCRACR